MSIGRLYVLFGEVSIHILYSFLIGLFGFMMLSFISSLYILDISTLSEVSANVLPFSGLSFYFVDCFLCCAKTFYFDVVPFIYYFFCFPCLRRHIRKNISMSYVQDFTMFSSRIFMVSGLTFKSLIHFEFILVT